MDEQRPGPAAEVQQADAAKPAAATVAASAAAHPATATQSPEAGQRFEDAYRRLETLVGEMERGDLPLEDLLTRFEEGVRLVKHCRGFLKQAQLRVEQYIEQRDGQWVLKELE